MALNLWGLLTLYIGLKRKLGRNVLLGFILVLYLFLYLYIFFRLYIFILSTSRHQSFPIKAKISFQFNRLNYILVANILCNFLLHSFFDCILWSFSLLHNSFNSRLWSFFFIFLQQLFFLLVLNDHHNIFIQIDFSWLMLIDSR